MSSDQGNAREGMAEGRKDYTPRCDSVRQRRVISRYGSAERPLPVRKTIPIDRSVKSIRHSLPSLPHSVFRSQKARDRELKYKRSEWISPAQYPENPTTDRPNNSRRFQLEN
jgi:hypothetical protein